MHSHASLTFETTNQYGTFTFVHDKATLQKRVKDIKRFQKNVIAKKLHYYSSWKLLSESEKQSRAAKKLEEMTADYSHHPKVSGASPYKLHITLAEKSYTADIQEHLKNILIHYLHVVPSFKFVDLTVLQEELAFKKEYQKTLTTFLSQELSPVDKSNFCIMASAYGINRQSWQTINIKDIKDLIKTVADDLAHIQAAITRFSQADQFTLYIPTDVDKTALLRMCQKIDGFLAEQKAEPGNCTRAELKIGKYMNFRQQHFLEDHKALMKGQGSYEFYKIQADENSEHRLEKLRSEMEHSSLYQHLSTQLDKPVSPDAWQTMWDKTQGDFFDKACAMLAHYAGSFDRGANDTHQNRYIAGSVGRFLKVTGTHTMLQLYSVHLMLVIVCLHKTERWIIS